MNKDKWLVGDVVICTKASSIAYKEGKKYTVVLNNDEGKGLIGKGLFGEDGFFDLKTNLISSFKKVKES